MVLFDEVEGLVHRREHPQGQEVDLDHAGIVHRVLVPLHQHPPLHGRLLQGNQLHQRPGGYDHAAHVLADVSREAGDLLHEVRQVAP